MLVMAAILACLAGFSGIALSMIKHARDLLGQANTPRKRRLFRVAGWALLVLSLAACIAAWGGSIGLVAWFGLATVAALLVAIALAHAPSGTLSSGGSPAARKGNTG